MEKLLQKKIMAHPFIKWVGGKSQLLLEIKESLPKDFSKMEDVIYVEPFVGGGAVLFWILQNYPNITKAVINDVNPELMCTYRVIQNKVDALREYLPLNNEDRKSYYLNKRILFNSKSLEDVEMAALFIFLNRTCFNGLYRVNSKGDFNVPHGKYTNPKICDRDNLLLVSDLLKKVEILCGDFSQTLQYASDRALFYFDPPYKPLSETSAFTSYAVNGFDDSEQIRLRNFCENVAARKSLFIVSNSDPRDVNPKEDFFDRIYQNFNIRRVSAMRMINSVASGRGAVREVIISNI